jgi:hypothetical protein
MDNEKGSNGLPPAGEPPRELSRGFRFRVAMTIVFFILAVVYILWLVKML